MAVRRLELHALWLALSAASLLAARPAHALFFERYFVCKDDSTEVELRPNPEPAAPPPRLEALPKRPRPQPLEVLPLLVADVTIQDPIPRGHREKQPNEPPEPVVVLKEASNDYRCIGLPRGKAGIVRVVGAPPGARFLRHTHPESWIEENLDAVGAFDLRETTPLLLRTLERPIAPALETWQKLNRLKLKVAAARALADLGERKAVPALVAFLKQRETEDYPGFWEESVADLGRLDPAAGHDYAVEALARIAAKTTHETPESNRVLKLLPLLVRRDAQALAALRAISQKLDPQGSGGNFESCRVYAARIRTGDDSLREGFRKELSVDLRTNRSVVCFSETMEAAFPGADADEVDALLFRHRYEELLRLVPRLDAADAKHAAARKTIRAWLDQRKSDPDVALDTTDRRFHPDTRARHLALAAALGDKVSERELWRLIDDPKDDGTAPWVAAAAAFDLGLAGAADHAVVRLLLARTQHMSRHNSRGWERRGRVLVTEHVEIVDRLAQRDDARFVFGLLDRDIPTREASVHWLARKRPQDACKLVIRNAAGAEERAIQDALWALSVLGDSCRAELRAVLAAGSAPPELQGMALEALAMLREAVKPPSSGAADPLRPARERAKIILHSPE